MHLVLAACDSQARLKPKTSCGHDERVWVLTCLWCLLGGVVLSSVCMQPAGQAWRRHHACHGRGGKCRDYNCATTALVSEQQRWCRCVAATAALALVLTWSCCCCKLTGLHVSSLYIIPTLSQPVLTRPCSKVALMKLLGCPVAPVAGLLGLGRHSTGSVLADNHYL